MSPRYEVMKRLCLPSGAALPSLLSAPWLWGSPALSSPVARPHGEARRPPTAHRNHSHRTIWEVRALPQPPGHGIILEADPVPPGRTSGSRPADNLTGFCPPRQAIWQRPS